MNTKTHFLSRGAKMVFIAAWRVAGALVNPNGVTLNSNKPL
jgi:hypothetical protein